MKTHDTMRLKSGTSMTWIKFSVVLIVGVFDRETVGMINHSMRMFENIDLSISRYEQ